MGHAGRCLLLCRNDIADGHDSSSRRTVWHLSLIGRPQPRFTGKGRKMAYKRANVRVSACMGVAGGPAGSRRLVAPHAAEKEAIFSRSFLLSRPPASCLPARCPALPTPQTCRRIRKSSSVWNAVSLAIYRSTPAPAAVLPARLYPEPMVGEAESATCWSCGLTSTS
ncbi:hypothetical protein LZ31DRAFT_257172 [Colletotrichum somersetense]|nr:hypothetical protein LZ31DRAFT_257172 [Colletotrichum somersetense]